MLQNPKFLLIFVFLLSLMTAADAGLRKAPVFTKKQYQQLIASGRDLTFSERSLWLPEPFRQSLLVVLKHSLTDQYSKDSVLQISQDDFFHGHILCSGDERAQNLIHEIDTIERNQFETICASKSLITNMRDASCRPQLKQALINSENLIGQRLQQSLDRGECAHWAVLYHTREYNRPEGTMSSNDPARNIRVDLPNLQITHFQPVEIDINNLALYLPQIDRHTEGGPTQNLHQDVMVSHFGFFIDPNGVVHMSIGSGFQLSIGYDFRLNH